MESDGNIFFFVLLFTVFALWSIVPGFLRRRGLPIRELESHDVAVYTVLTLMGMGGLVMLFSLSAKILALLIPAAFVWDWRIRRRRSERARSVLGSLADLFGSDEQIARVMDLDGSLLAEWRRGWIPEPASWNRIAELSGLVEALKVDYALADIGMWLVLPNSHLEGYTPLFLVRSGRNRDLLRAIEVNDACLPRQPSA